MKKIISILFIVIFIFSIFSINVQATQITGKQVTSQLIEIKEKELKEMKDYNEAYGSEAYGMTAYILNKIRIYSIPFCFVGIAFAAIYQYIIGIRRVEIRERGFSLMVIMITVFVICQILPLVFAIVVQNWRG